MRVSPPTSIRVRWAAIGAAVAVSLGGTTIGIVNATSSSGERPVFVPITPCRLFDTRATEPIGPRSTPLAAGETYQQAVRGTNGNCVLPPDAVGVALNMTAVNGTAPSYLTVWPADAAKPLASSLNWVAGAPPTPNKVDVKLGADGAIKLYNNAGSVDVLADAVGYYVDHTHDDRYYQKAESDGRYYQKAESDSRYADKVQRLVIGTEGFHDNVGGPLLLHQGCNAGYSARANLALPVGTVIRSLDVTVYDEADPIFYGFNVVREDVTPGGIDFFIVESISGGTNPTLTSHTTVRHIDMSVGNVVTETSSFVVGWTDSTPATQDNGLCQVVVEYELP